MLTGGGAEGMAAMLSAGALMQPWRISAGDPRRRDPPSRADAASRARKPSRERYRSTITYDLALGFPTSRALRPLHVSDRGDRANLEVRGRPPGLCHPGHSPHRRPWPTITPVPSRSSRVLSPFGCSPQYLASQFMMRVVCTWQGGRPCVLGKRDHVLRPACACF